MLARAQTGDAEAQFALSRIYYQSSRSSQAVDMLTAAARNNLTLAQYELGTRLMVGDGAALDLSEGARWLEAAAQAGHADALSHVAVFHARGIDRVQDWGAALNLLERAAAAGDAAATGQLATFSAGFDVTAWLQAPAPRLCFADARVGVIEGFLPPEMCAWLIRRARPQLTPTTTTDPATGERRVDPRRSNMFAPLSLLRLDLVASLVKARIASALQMPVSHQEIAQVFRYQPGQRFDVHFDFLHPDQPGFFPELARLGQRVATFLIYLNEDFDGGDTDFPDLGWRFKGRTGDALFFWNVDADGQVDTRLSHAGLPPSRGEKWLFSQWTRANAIAAI